MPTPNASKVSSKDDVVRFLADRLAVLMAELVARDLDFGDFCHDEFYQLDRVRNNQHYPVCMDFVRNMVRRRLVEQAEKVDAGRPAQD